MFLSDTELAPLVDNGNVVLHGPSLEDRFSRESPLQPSSIDLTIGEIFLPTAKTRLPWRHRRDHPRDEHSLGQGQTAVVEIWEEISLPSDIGAFGFPPARVSRNGLLMTNPGHVDPGFVGKLSFTLVNMGREPFHLKRGDAICTLLFFRLPVPPARSYMERVGHRSEGVESSTLQKLSPDFLDINERSAAIAKQTVVRAQLFTPILSAVITGIVAIILNYWLFQADLKDKIAEVDKKVEVINQEVNNDRRLDDLDNRLRKVEPTPTPQR